MIAQLRTSCYLRRGTWHQIVLRVTAVSKTAPALWDYWEATNPVIKHAVPGL